jgi:hypothetical protein
MRKRRVGGALLALGLSVVVWALGCNNSASSLAANQGGVAGGFANAVDPNAAGTGSANTRGGSAGTGTAGATTRGGSGGTGGSGRGTAGTMGGTAGSASGSAPTFTNVYAILMQNCAGGGCHLSSPGAAGLLMSDKMTAYTNLVGASSSKCFGQQRVVAGNPDTSVLLLALEHMRSGSCRAPSMPQGRPQLSAADLATIRGWIMGGALND